MGSKIETNTSKGQKQVRNAFNQNKNALKTEIKTKIKLKCQKYSQSSQA